MKRVDIYLRIAKAGAVLTTYGLVLWIGFHVLLRGGLTIMTPAADSEKARPGWDYRSEDIALENRLTAEMAVQDDKHFSETLQNAGAGGYELVGVMPLPLDGTRRSRFRLLFKRPAAHTFLRTNSVAEDEAYSAALQAEHKAQAEAFRASLR